jgi:CPA2 family monovalent cation:H+ antiporter-2
MESWGLLAQIVVLLAAALVVGGVLARFNQNPLLGYILAGTLMGSQGGVGLVDSEHGIAVIAEIGVSLLLFSLGLEFSWQRLKSFGARTLFGGAVQVVGTAVAAALVGFLLGLGTAEAIAVGAMLSLSSTAAVLRVLTDVGEADSLHGRNSVAILLAQDIAVVPLAVLVTLLAGAGTGMQIAMDVGRVLLFGAALVV